jgi:membrane protein YqaA with SNARE-associated domain
MSSDSPAPLPESPAGKIPRPVSLILRLVVLGGVVAFSIYLVSIRDEISHLGIVGYPGVFLISMISSATILIPVPGVMVTSTMGAVFNPFWVAVAAGSGAAIGELSGYLAGFGGRVAVERYETYHKIEHWIKRYGVVIILVLAMIPNPFFDLVGIVAGIARIPIPKFLFFCLIGNVLKMMLFSYGGATIENLLLPNFE